MELVKRLISSHLVILCIWVYFEKYFRWAMRTMQFFYMWQSKCEYLLHLNKNANLQDNNAQVWILYILIFWKKEHLGVEKKSYRLKNILLKLLKIYPTLISAKKEDPLVIHSPHFTPPPYKGRDLHALWISLKGVTLLAIDAQIWCWVLKCGCPLRWK